MLSPCQIKKRLTIRYIRSDTLVLWSSAKESSKGWRGVTGGYVVKLSHLQQQYTLNIIKTISFNLWSVWSCTCPEQNCRVILHCHRDTDWHQGTENRWAPSTHAGKSLSHTVFLFSWSFDSFFCKETSWDWLYFGLGVVVCYIVYTYTWES